MSSLKIKRNKKWMVVNGKKRAFQFMLEIRIIIGYLGEQDGKK